MLANSAYCLIHMRWPNCTMCGHKRPYPGVGELKWVNTRKATPILFEERDNGYVEALRGTYVEQKIGPEHCSAYRVARWSGRHLDPQAKRKRGIRCKTRGKTNGSK